MQVKSDEWVYALSTLAKLLLFIQLRYLFPNHRAIRITKMYLTPTLQVVGMIGGIEYAIADHRIDVSGNFWKPTQHDTTIMRECSTPFMLAPYQG